MEVANVIHNHRRYILDLEESNILKIFTEYKTVKKDVRCMGFHPGNYKKIITIKKQIARIILPNIVKEMNLKHIEEFADEIEKVGFTKADENILTNRKAKLFEGCNNLEQCMERVTLPSEEREKIKGFVFEHREIGDSFKNIASQVNIEYGLPISDTTTRRLYREACKEKGLEPLKRRGAR